MFFRGKREVRKRSKGKPQTSAGAANQGNQPDSGTRVDPRLAMTVYWPEHSAFVCVTSVPKRFWYSADVMNEQTIPR